MWSGMLTIMGGDERYGHVQTLSFWDWSVSLDLPFTSSLHFFFFFFALLYKISLTITGRVRRSERAAVATGTKVHSIPLVKLQFKWFHRVQAFCRHSKINFNTNVMFHAWIMQCTVGHLLRIAVAQDTSHLTSPLQELSEALWRG